MAERTEYLIAIVGADVTAFRKGMRDVRSELGLLDASSENTMARLGRTLTYTLTTPLAIGASVAVSAASEFDAAMRNINSVAFLTEERFSSLSQEVFDFGKNTRDGATGAAIALNTIYQAGLEGEAALYVMEAATYAAEAGLANIETTAEGLVATMLAFGFTTDEEATRAGDALTRMVQVGVGSMQAFAGSIATFLPSAAALGVQMEEAFGIDAMFTQFGYSASEAAVRVNAAMRSMIKPSEAMSAAIRKLGAGSAKELISMYGSLSEAIIALRGTTDGTEEAMAELFSDTRALQGVLLLTQNVERTRSVLADFMEDVDGATDRARQQQMMSFAYSWDRLGSAIEAAKIKIGQVFLPVLKPLIDGVRDVLIAFTEVETSTLAFGVSLAGLAAALGPVLWLSTSLISPFAAVTAAVVWLANETTKWSFALNELGEHKDTLQPLLDIFTEFRKGFEGDGPVLDISWGGPKLLTPDGMPELDVSPVVTYTVKEGDTLWGIWAENFKKDFPSFEDFKKAVGLDKPWLISPGDIISFGSWTETVATDTVTIERAVLGIGDRFSNAFRRVGAYIQESIPAIQNAFRTIIHAGMISLYSGIALIDNGIKYFFSGDWLTGAEGEGLFEKIKGGLDSFFSFEWLTDLVESVQNSPIATNMANLFDTIANVALPEIAKTAGYISAQVVRWFSRAIDGAFQWLAGGGLGDAAEVGGEYLSNLGASFSEGWASAGIDVELSTLSNSIAGSLSTMLDNVASIFEGGNSSEYGYTPLYEAFRNAFNYLFHGGLGEDIEGMDGSLGGSIQNLLDTIGEWVKVNAAPTLSRVAGYIVGTLGALIGKGINFVYSTLTGGQPEAASAIETAVIEPFQQGMKDAMGDMGVPAGNWMDNLLTGIAGAIALFALANPSIFGIAAAAIAGSLKIALLVFGWVTALIPAALNIVAGLAGALGLTSVGAGLWAGFIAKMGAAFVAATGAVTAATAWVASGIATLKSAITGALVGGGGAAAAGTAAGGAAGSAAGGAAGTSFLASLKAGLGTALSRAGLAGALATLLTVQGSTDRLIPTDTQIDLPIWVNPQLQVDFTLPSERQYQMGYGTGGLGGQLGSDLGEWLRGNIHSYDLVTELPLHIPKIRITGTPEEVEIARNFFPRTQLYEFMARYNTEIPFDDLFEIVPMEGFNLTDYIHIPDTVAPDLPEITVALPPIRVIDTNAGLPEGTGPTLPNPAVTEAVPMLNAIVSDIKQGILNTMSESGEVGNDLAEEVARSLTDGVNTHLLSNPISTEAVASAVVKPIESAIDGAFGATGSVTELWRGYDNTVQTSEKNMVASATKMNQYLPGLFMALRERLASPLAALIVQFDAVTASIAALVAEAGKLAGVQVPTPIAAQGGTAPYTTAMQTGDVPRGPAVIQPVTTNNSRNVNITFRDNTFKSEADVRRLVKELRKRGYDL